jgi:hypothetical protein
MAQPPPGTTVIYGANAGAIIGDALAAGDIHGDGFDDLFVGVPGDSGPLNRRSAAALSLLPVAPICLPSSIWPRPWCP